MTKKPTELVKLNLRFDEGLRATLEKRASKNNLSLNSEIVARLERSIDAEKVREERLADLRDYLSSEWGTDVFNIALSTSRALASIERFTGHRWVEDDHTFELFTLTLLQLAKNYRDIVMRNYGKEDPPGNRLANAKTDEQLAEVFAELSGISPPYPRPDKDAEYQAADRASSLREFKRKIAKSRPLPGDEA
ncbi:Arc family DNA-binding protein [Bradyrhizobium sp. USDA 4504]